MEKKNLKSLKSKIDKVTLNMILLSTLCEFDSTLTKMESQDYKMDLLNTTLQNITKLLILGILTKKLRTIKSLIWKSVLVSDSIDVNMLEKNTILWHYNKLRGEKWLIVD